MQGMPRHDQRVFEVSIYNREVRAMVKENRHHDHFDDHWADAQVRDIVAKTEDEARNLIARRYPPDEGFVIETINPCGPGGAD